MDLLYSQDSVISRLILHSVIIVKKEPYDIAYTL